MVEENKYMRTLTENAQGGKIVALEELYEINLNQVHTLVSRLAGNKLVAEQLMKSILVRAWERIGEDGPGERLFSDWIRDLSIHFTINELRDPNMLSDKKLKKQLKPILKKKLRKRIPCLQTRSSKLRQQKNIP